jgi:hypothetical protein
MLDYCTSNWAFSFYCELLSCIFKREHYQCLVLTLYELFPRIQSGGMVTAGVVVKCITGCPVLEILGTVEAIVVGNIVGQFSSSSPCGHSSVPSQI